MRIRSSILTFGLLAQLSLWAGPALAQSSAAAPDTLMFTLESAIQRSLDISPEVGAKAARRDYAIARRQLAKSHRFLSDFELTTAHSFSPGLKNTEGVPKGSLYLDSDVRNDWEALSPFTFVEVEALQPIFTWGELDGNIEAAKYGVDVEEGAMGITALEVAARTGEIYFGLMLAEALSRLTGEAYDAVNTATSEIENLLEEGDPDVDDADLFQVQIAEQEVVRRVAEVTQQLETMKSALSRQLILPQGTVPDLERTVLKPLSFEVQPLEMYQQLALVHRPEMVQTEAGIAARDALVNVAESDYYPKLFLAASSRYSFAIDRYRQRNPYVGDPFLTRGFEAGLGFRQKLNFSQTRAKVEQARSELEETKFQGQAAEQLILFEVEEAYRNVLIAQSAVDTQSEALRLSKEWLRSEEINFDLDLGDTENLVRAVQTKLTLQAAENEAIFKYNVAVIRLMRSSGILLQAARNGTFVE